MKTTERELNTAELDLVSGGTDFQIRFFNFTVEGVSIFGMAAGNGKFATRVDYGDGKSITTTGQITTT